MELTGYVECPYCHIQVRVKTSVDYDKKIITCDIDDGGCDRDFVVVMGAVIKSTVLKIEGEE